MNHGNFHDLTGRKFGRLTVLSCAGRKKGSYYKWNCRCECGNEKVIFGHSMVRGFTVACGCLGKQALGNATRTHGMTRTKIYQAWKSMIQRCCNRNSTAYPLYGGRGIKVCDRWRRSFECFAMDMGELPEGMTLERMDNNGNYEPKNCCWATRKEQANNRRGAKKIDYCGISLSVPEWARLFSVRASRVYRRLRQGVDFERALFTPSRQREA